MLQALPITVREGFEAALVIGIMLTYATKSGRAYLRRPIALGAISAVVLSIAVAFGINALGINAENPAVEGTLYLVAAAFVVSMVVWMWRASGDVRSSLVEGIERASVHSAGAGLAVAAVAFFMIAREGIETVLFLAANTLDQGLVPTLIGSAIGLGIAFGLGAAIYYGAAKIDMKLFFAATSIALLLLAARFVGIGILALGEAGVYGLPTTVMAGLEQLEKGILGGIVGVAVVVLPLGAIGWSLLKRPPAQHAL